MEIENESENDTQEHEDKELLDEAKERYKAAEEYWSENYKAAIEDMEFRAGNQWPEEVKNIRKNRPCLVVDKTNQYIRQVVNDGRQNRPSVKVRPVDSGADIEVAEIFQGIIRHIQDRSNADIAFDSALESAVVGGFGFFRVLTEYAHGNTFNQDILIKRVRNPLTVLIEPPKEADGSDITYGFITEDLKKEEFKAKYPKAKFNDWEANKERYGDWSNSEEIKVCEYWYKEDKDVLVHLLDDGTVEDDDLYQKAVNAGIQVPAIIQSRTIQKPVVKWCRMSGAEILERKEWAGEYIPIIPVFGNEYDIDGKVTYSGLIRTMKDPARLYNYSRSAFAERVALTPKAPFVAAAGQVENYPEWEDANSGDYAVLRYDPMELGGSVMPPPQRQSASDIPAGFAQDMQLAEHDIQASIGMYQASLGAQGNEKSGKAILARQREGDVGTFHYHDNLSRSIRHLGRILVDLIPKIYDTSRVVRIIGEDGKVENAEINPAQDVAVIKVGKNSIYNLNVGEYDVTVSAGASYTTKRQEAAEAMVQLSQANPAMFPLIGDIMIKNMDWPGAEEIAERLKIMLPPQLQKKEEQDIPPQVRQAIDMSSQQIQQQEQVIQQLQEALNEKQTENQKSQVNAQIEAAKLQLESQKIEIERMKAETERIQVSAEAQNNEEAKLMLDKYKADLEAETIKWKANLEADTKIQLETMKALGEQFSAGV